MKAENWKETLYSRTVIIIYSGKFQILAAFVKCSLRREVYTDQKKKKKSTKPTKTRAKLQSY